MKCFFHFVEKGGGGSPGRLWEIASLLEENQLKIKNQLYPKEFRQKTFIERKWSDQEIFQTAVTFIRAKFRKVCIGDDPSEPHPSTTPFVTVEYSSRNKPSEGV